MIHTIQKQVGQKQAGAGAGKREDAPPSSEPAGELGDFAEKLSVAKAKHTPRIAQGGGSASMVGLAYRLIIEVVAGIAVGGFIGWWLDKWFSTAPVMMLVLIFLGMIAGVMGSVRTAAEMRRRLDKN